MRRRLLVVFSILIATIPVFLLATPAADAVGPCSTSNLQSQGYGIVALGRVYSNGGTANYDAGLEFWRRSSDASMVVRAANYVADGKSGVYASGGTSGGSANLGQSGSIGSAPSGGWCSNTARNKIFGYLSYYIGSTYYSSGIIGAG